MSWSLDEQAHISTGAERYDVSAKKLFSMSPAELTAALEYALDTMTEETYDSAVINAYLAELDRKTPIRSSLDIKASFAEFQHKLLPFSALSSNRNTVYPVKQPSRLRRLLHSALVAALIVVGLLGGIVVAQASGIDVFATMAHWTESILSFGPLPSEISDSSQVSAQSEFQEDDHADLDWRDELKVSMENHNLLPQILKAPDDFTEKSHSIFVDPITGSVGFSILYTNGSKHISFDFSEFSGVPTAIYEKDNNNVEQYVYNEVVHYIYTNNENFVAAWVDGNLEYCISTNSSSIEIKDLIKSVYEV